MWIAICSLIGMVKNLAKIGALVVILIAVITFTLSLKGGNSDDNNKSINTGTITLTLQDDILDGENVVYRFHAVGMEGIQTFLGEEKAESDGVTEVEFDSGSSTKNIMITRIKSGNKKRQTIAVDSPNLTLDFRR